MRLETVRVVKCSSCKADHKAIVITAKESSFYFCQKTEDRVRVEAA